VEAWTLDIAWKFHGAYFVTEFAGTVCGYTLLLLIFFFFFISLLTLFVVILYCC
jgi:hypothetical protein